MVGPATYGEIVVYKEPAPQYAARSTQERRPARPVLTQRPMSEASITTG
jgi:hypothetical protein